MFITGVGTATPAQRYTQIECWEVLQRSRHFEELKPRSQAILRKVLTGQSGIHTRHLALNDLNEAFQMTPDALHDRFEAEAPRLAIQAARSALQKANQSPQQIDAVLVSTCTGYLCPGLSSYVAEGLGLRGNILGLDLVGQGCGAALPNLRAAEALLTSGLYGRVLSVCVEVCSAAFYLDNDPGVLISACLFGDGAGAAVLSVENGAERRLEWKSSDSVLKPKDRNVLRFEQKDGMLRNVLGLQVPAMAAREVAGVCETLLSRAGLPREKVAAWILHPGGRDVLTAIGKRLNLTETDLRWSAQVLRECGNISSASLYFVLAAALREDAPGGCWLLSSFGAGFSCHGALLEVV